MVTDPTAFLPCTVAIVLLFGQRTTVIFNPAVFVSLTNVQSFKLSGITV